MLIISLEMITPCMDMDRQKVGDQKVRGVGDVGMVQDGKLVGHLKPKTNKDVLQKVGVE